MVSQRHVWRTAELVRIQRVNYGRSNKILELCPTCHNYSRGVSCNNDRIHEIQCNWSMRQHRFQGRRVWIHRGGPWMFSCWMCWFVGFQMAHMCPHIVHIMLCMCASAYVVKHIACELCSREITRNARQHDYTALPRLPTQHQSQSQCGTWSRKYRDSFDHVGRHGPTN